MTDIVGLLRFAKHQTTWILLFTTQLANHLNAQPTSQYVIKENTIGKNLTAVIKEMEDNNQLRFFYLPEWTDPFSLEENFAGKSIFELMDNLFANGDLTYLEMYPLKVVIIKDPQRALERKIAIENAMREDKKIQLQIVGNPKKSKKGTVILTGQVVDSKSKEAMGFTNIKVNDTNAGTTADEKGNYKLNLPAGNYILVFSFVDYESKVVDLGLYENGALNIEMEKMPTLLEEIVVESKSSQELVTARIGQTQLSIKDIKRAPALMGEADLIKQVQTLPGVTTVGEAATGFNVRGGSVDQNLILYDGLPVFNSAHVFGFLSAFNSEALKNVSFYKGGIPAEYGGRVS
ncbi:MAG: carboxypeptidase-like regulatory domain-containing protein, partial [Cytophagales bacterium]